MTARNTLFGKPTVFLFLAMLIGVVAMTSEADARVLKRRLAADMSGPNLIDPENWAPWDAGFELENGVIHCDNGDDTEVRRGAGQQVHLNQTTPLPIVATAESRAQGVTGSRNPNYSLYLDIVYTDGTPQWGQISAFSVGTHDWERRRVLFMPRKPIATVSVYVLLRGHGGEAWFRNVTLHEIRTPAGTITFDGIPVTPQEPLPEEGFHVVDVAAEGDIVSFENGRAEGLRLRTSRRQHNGASILTVHLDDTTGRDRAVTLYYTVRLADQPWRWLPEPSHDEQTQSGREYVDSSRFDAGANGRLGRYPIGAVCTDSDGHALGLDPLTPVFSRVGYNADTRELFVACDIGLTPEKPTATFRLVRFAFAPSWGFRGALQTLYQTFPDAFRCRVERQGLWMPFAKISEVERWQDFGFRFKEGNNETAWDDAHDIITFRYTEPMTWWMSMDASVPRTVEAALAQARTLAQSSPDTRDGRRAKALLTSGFHDHNGAFIAQLRDTPWCDGAVWSMNAMPDIPGDVTDFSLKWNDDLKQRLYEAESKGVLDGEYIDSSEGYVTAVLDFRRDHFAAAETPLTFALDGHQPAIFRGLIAAEYARAIARDVHGMNKLMMANSTPIRLWFLAPYLDVMGSETNWNPGGTWRPLSRTDLLYRRALCAAKPYCFLQNTDFEAFSRDKVERYMKRCLAYGMFPGFFSHNASEGHYFRRPEIYNRDRDLFKRYIPLCKKVAEAGWEPVTLASANDDEIWVERFGEHILTVFNPADEPRTAQVTVSLPSARQAVDLLEKQDLPVETRNGHLVITVSLGPEDVAVLQLSP